MRACFCSFLIFMLLVSDLSAQDITGLWKGTLYNDTTQQFYRYEIAISEEKGKLTGFSHTWFILDDKQYFGIKKVKIKKKDDKYLVEDDELIANNYPVEPAKGVRQLNILTLEIRDSIMEMTGPFSTNRTKDYRALTGNITVQRRNDFWQSALVPHLQELGKAEQLSFVKEETKQTLAAETKKVNDEAVLAKAESEKAKLIAEEATRKEAERLKEQAALAKIEQDRIEKEKQDALLSNVVVNKKDIKTEKVVVNKTSSSVATPVAINKKIIPIDTADVVRNETVVTPVIIKAPPPVVKENKPAVTVAAQNVALRSTELQQTVYFKTDSLQLSLFDNGEVDGDTVSVLMNGKIIFSKERMSTNAVRKTIFIDPSADSVVFVMYAENLGTIAPNTGLLVVKDGKELHEIRFSGDLKKNAAIVFRRRK